MSDPFTNLIQSRSETSHTLLRGSLDLWPNIVFSWSLISRQVNTSVCHTRCRSFFTKIPFIAAAPFVIVNTVAGALTFYGLCGLRDDVKSIFIAVAIITLHSLTAQQFTVFCVWITETQVTICDTLL